MARFLNDSFDYGIEIELVLGYSQWAKKENHNDCLQFVDAVLDFVASLGYVNITKKHLQDITTTGYSTTAFTTTPEDGIAPSIETEYYVLQIPNVLHLDIEPHNLDSWSDGLIK